MYLLHLTSWIINPLGLLRLCGTMVTALFQMWSCLLDSGLHPGIFSSAPKNLLHTSGAPFMWNFSLFGLCDVTRRCGLSSVWIFTSTCQWHRSVLCFPAFHPQGAVCLSDLCSWVGSNFLWLCVVPEDGNASEMEAISCLSSQRWGRILATWPFEVWTQR